MQHFRIRLKAKNPQGKSLYLKINDQGETTLTPNPNDDAQWTFTCLVIGKTFFDRQIVNPRTGRILCAPQNEKPVIGLLISEITEEKRSTWNIFSREDEYRVIQLSNNHDLNLNALGSGPYVDGTPVYAWGWKGGEPNEVWALEQI